MTTQVYFFTRTGNSQRIAQKIAKALTCDIHQIKDNINWKGIRAYFKFLVYASGKKTIEITCDSEPDAADELIVIAPIWGSMLAPTVSQFLATIDRQKINLITSAGSSELKDQAGYQSITTITNRSQNEDTAINDFLKKIQD